MATKKRQFRFVYRHSPLVLKCVVLATIILSVAALTVVRLSITQANQENDALRAQAAQLEQENERLKENTAAKEELGMVDADTVFFDVQDNQN